MNARTLTGAEELRKLASMIDGLSETFLDRFTLEELVTLTRAWRASEWDKYPDAEWTEEQIAAALRGVPPAWDSDEKPEDEDGSARFPLAPDPRYRPAGAPRGAVLIVDRVVRETREKRDMARALDHAARAVDRAERARRAPHTIVQGPVDALSLARGPKK